MIGHLLKTGGSDLVIDDEDAGNNAKHLVEQVDFGHVVSRTPYS